MREQIIQFAIQIQGLDTNLPKVDASHSNITTILNALYIIAGALAVIFIVFGGIKYSLSGGDSSKVVGAKNTILYAIVGLVIAIFAFAITNFVISKVDVSSFNALRDSAINTLLYVAGSIAVIMILFGAFRYVTSGGDASKVTQAKNTILYAVIGLVIAILAFAIVNFVLTRL
jgi:uncharacterized membrane protein